MRLKSAAVQQGTEHPRLQHQQRHPRVTNESLQRNQQSPFAQTRIAQPDYLQTKCQVDQAVTQEQPGILRNSQQVIQQIKKQIKNQADPLLNTIGTETKGRYAGQAI
jgi:hypothetical protein